MQGKADETEVLSDDDEASGAEADPEAKARSREEKEKRKMRGKNKSLKRCIITFLSLPLLRSNKRCHRYLRKQRKNVIDPTAVSYCILLLVFPG